MAAIGFTDLLIIIVIGLIFFGGKKIPDIAKSIGESIHVFKKAINEDDKKDQKK
jgi:sec-independent protein translocase protein TatA